MRMSRRIGLYSGNPPIPTQADYTGSCEIIRDSLNDWRMKLYTSGTLTLRSNLNVDIFIVGGGAGGRKAGNNEYTNYGGDGGSGGQTNLVTGLTLAAGTGYAVTIGAGGPTGGTNVDKSGGQSAFDTYTAPGGYHNGSANDGSNNYGGSGGGGGTYLSDNAGLGNGGSDGTDGYRYQGYGYGKGMNTLNDNNTIKWVREFREAGADLYGGGGGAGAKKQRGESFKGKGGAGGGGDGGYGTSEDTREGRPGTTNTGGGGGGGTGKTSGGYNGGVGGAGIVIIRNHRG